MTTRNTACPVCSTDLRPHLSGDSTLAICPQCGGFWYPEGSLREGLGRGFRYQAFIANMALGASRRICPDCDHALTALTYTCASGSVEIDHCTDCLGFWLDRGELQTIRRILPSEGGRRPPSNSAPVSPDTGPMDPESARSHYRSMDQGAAADYHDASMGTRFFCIVSQLPVEVFNPRRYFPLTLLGVILVNVLAFCWFALMAGGDQGSVVMVLGAVPERIVEHGEWSRLLSSMFLHGGWMHLLLNMYVLWIFGDNVHDIFRDHGPIKGPLMFLAFFLGVGIVAGLAHCLWALPHPLARIIPAIGASGAISGVMAAYWRLFPRSRLYQVWFFQLFKVPLGFYFFFWIGCNVLMALQKGSLASVSWQAHLGGFAAGYLLIGLFLPYSIESIQKHKPLLA